MRRPYVIMNAGMTLDGKLATVAGDTRISGKEDLERVHRIRAEVDAVMVGIGTVLHDDPRLTVHRVESSRQPARVVADSLARTPPGARVLSDEAPTIIGVSEAAPEHRVQRLKEAGAEVVVCGERRVELPCFMERLYGMGIRKLLLEGGGELNFSMLREGLVDEVRVAIAPVIVGGRSSVTLADGEGFESIDSGVQLRLLRYYPLGKDLVLEYEVVR